MADYTYDLPEHHIAYLPLPQRDESKLLVWDQGSIAHDHFYNLDDYLPKDGLLVFNQTKVIAARLFFLTAEQKKIELFLLEPQNGNYQALYDTHTSTWKCMVGGLKKWKSNDALVLEYSLQNQTGRLIAEKKQIHDQFVLIEFTWNIPGPFISVINAAGAIPLPPYIKRESDINDKERYQTIYAKDEGSVAAPTAGLHFTERIMDKLKQKNTETSFVTLHVGAGTFKPVQANAIGEHEMHEEYFEVEMQSIEKWIEHVSALVAVGTTSMRTIESIYWVAVQKMKYTQSNWNDIRISQWEHLKYENTTLPSASEALRHLINEMKNNSVQTLSGRTSICITPGYRFRVVNMLITNFHQPQSTLLLLIAAIMGTDWKKTYKTALELGYRFLSYGDTSLLKISNEN